MTATTHDDNQAGNEDGRPNGEQPPIGGGQPWHLETLFDGLTGEADGDTITVGAILHALAHRSFGPLLLLPALISVLPIIGALPGITWTMSALCLLISIQFLFNRQSLWLPREIRDIKIPLGAFERSVEWARPWLRRMDRFVHPRFDIMLDPPWPFLIAILCVLLSLAMFIASIVPGGVVVPAIGLMFLAIGLTTHDGLVLLIGALASLAGIWAVRVLVF